MKRVWGGVSRIDAVTDKWQIGDAAADYIFCKEPPAFELPGTVKVILYYEDWLNCADKTKCVPLLDASQYLDETLELNSSLKFVMIKLLLFVLALPIRIACKVLEGCL